MALNAAAHTVIVTPTGDDRETEHGRLIVINQDANHQHTIYQGVVESVGSHVLEGLNPGDLLHYTAFLELKGKHSVSEGHIVAWEDSL